ncbi:MgtC/SapB family protein [Candidatus Woesearchaeota archaeon]|nr:MgtC/SapB family protein [Candidatus Woesearchaeota archaeon]
MEWSIVGKIFLTFALASLFGYERQKAHKPIGFGTYIFVSVGACSLGIVAHILAPENPLPLLAAVISGIGFLGAGALIKTSDKVFGFSSAASIWIFAIFGLIIGVGEYFIALLLYACVILVIAFDKVLEQWGVGSYQKRILIVTNKVVPEKDIELALKTGRVKLKKIHSEVNKKDNTISILFQIEGSRKSLVMAQKSLYEKPWLSSMKTE